MSRSAVRTGDLNWERFGGVGRPDLVLLHSLGTGIGMWAPQLDVFAPVRRVLAIDFPGHGGSSANPGEYTLPDLGNDVLAVADEAGLGLFDVCGISIGGLVSLWLAINHPDRVRTLIAADTAARIGSRELWSDRITAVSTSGMDAIRSQVVARFFTAEYPGREPDMFARIEEMFVSVDPVGYIGCCAALRDADLSSDVAAIVSPTLVLCGEEDIATPRADAEFLHGRIAGSSLRMIPGAAHLPNLDRPDAFNREVLDFVDG